MTTRIYPGDRRLARKHLAIGNYARAYELDPTLRPRKPLALDAATENAIIERAIRAARKPPTSPTRTTMPRRQSYRPIKLFSRHDRGGESFAEYVATSRDPVKFWTARVRDASRRARSHAFDSGAEHAEALEQLERMARHIDLHAGTAQFDSAYLAHCFRKMLEAMGPEDAEDETDEERSRAATGEDEEEEPESETRYAAQARWGHPQTSRTGGRSGGPQTSGVGETRARAVTGEGRRRDVDHRNDFRSLRAGAADSALDAGYRPIKLFSRVA